MISKQEVMDTDERDSESTDTADSASQNSTLDSETTAVPVENSQNNQSLDTSGTLDEPSSDQNQSIKGEVLDRKPIRQQENPENDEPEPDTVQDRQAGESNPGNEHGTAQSTETEPDPNTENDSQAAVSPGLKETEKIRELGPDIGNNARGEASTGLEQIKKGTNEPESNTENDSQETVSTGFEAESDPENDSQETVSTGFEPQPDTENNSHETVSTGFEPQTDSENTVCTESKEIEKNTDFEPTPDTENDSQTAVSTGLEPKTGENQDSSTVSSHVGEPSLEGISKKTENANISDETDARPINNEQNESIPEMKNIGESSENYTSSEVLNIEKETEPKSASQNLPEKSNISGVFSDVPMGLFDSSDIPSKDKDGIEPMDFTEDSAVDGDQFSSAHMKPSSDAVVEDAGRLIEELEYMMDTDDIPASGDPPDFMTDLI